MRPRIHKGAKHRPAASACERYRLSCRKWRGSTIRCWCDTMAVIAILKSGCSRDERVMHLMRSFFFFLASYNITVVGEHIPGIENGAADALSRDNRTSFLVQVPAAHREPTAIPQVLVQALVIDRPDWTSPSWTRLLSSFLQRV